LTGFVVGAVALRGGLRYGRCMKSLFDRIDPLVAGWMERNGIRLLRWSVGLVFVWFGALKTVGMSPAQELVARTVYWFPPEVFIPILGWWEVVIGLGLLYRRLARLAIALLFLQMPGTFLPLVLLPEICFTSIPFGLTIEGQYIVKNLVLISAAIVVGGTVREQSARRL
jgi:uncharacterized membrane protein YkgB